MTLPPERQFAISELNLFSRDAQLSVFISTIGTPEKNLTGSRFDVFECFSGLYFDRTLRQIKRSFFFRASDVIFIFFMTWGVEGYAPTIKCMDSGCDATLIFSAEWDIRLNTLPGLRFPAIFGYQRFRPLSSHKNCKRPSNDMLFCETPPGVFLLSAGTIEVDSESDEANATASLMP